jgi:hypothetical protein
VLEMTVRAVGAIRSDDDSVVLAFGESDSGFGRVLIMARLLAEDGRALPQEPYSVSTETGATVYGGVDDWTRVDASIELSLSRTAALDLGLPQQLRLVFTDLAATHQAERGLAWMLEPRTPVPGEVFETPGAAGGPRP